MLALARTCLVFVALKLIVKKKKKASQYVDLGRLKQAMKRASKTDNQA